MLEPGQVDLGALGHALDDRTQGVVWFLDPYSGEVASRAEGAPPPDGWMAIDSTTTRDGYRDMSDFTAAVQHRRAAELLEGAIDGRGAFRRFKNALFEFPEVRDQWYRFRDARSRRRALDWLVDNDLVEKEAAEREAARYPDPAPTNEDLPASVAEDLAALYGARLRQVLLFGSWASGEGSVESDLDLLVVLDDRGAAVLPWEELRQLDDLLWLHTERSGITITALPIGQSEMSRPSDPAVIRARAEAVRLR